jgi:hypothetical protein
MTNTIKCLFGALKSHNSFLTESRRSAIMSIFGLFVVIGVTKSWAAQPQIVDQHPDLSTSRYFELQDGHFKIESVRKVDFFTQQERIENFKCLGCTEDYREDVELRPIPESKIHLVEVRVSFQDSSLAGRDFDDEYPNWQSYKLNDFTVRFLATEFSQEQMQAIREANRGFFTRRAKSKALANELFEITEPLVVKWKTERAVLGNCRYDGPCEVVGYEPAIVSKLKIQVRKK